MAEGLFGPLEQPRDQRPALPSIDVVSGSEDVEEMPLLQADLAPVRRDDDRDCQERVQLAGNEGGAEIHAEHGAIDRMPDEPIGSRAHQLVADLLGDGSTPVTPQTAPG